MSGASALSAAKRRRGNVPVNPPPNPDNNATAQKANSAQPMPHPLVILKDHEIRIRKLESMLMDNINRITALETHRPSNNDGKIPKHSVTFASDNIEPTFSKLKLVENN